MTNYRNWIVPLSSAVVGAIAVAFVWFVWVLMTDEPPVPSRSITVNSTSLIKSYSSIDEMSADADIVVVGSVTGVAQTGLDWGRDSSLITPIPYTVYSVEVVEVLQGDIGGTPEIYVARRNPEDFPDVPLTRLNKGETFVIYLEELKTSEVTPTITVTDIFYVPLAFDNALLDISTSGEVGAMGRVNDDVLVVPRATEHSMFPRGTTFTMAQVRDAVVDGKGEIGPIGNAN